MPGACAFAAQPVAQARRRRARDEPVRSGSELNRLPHLIPGTGRHPSARANEKFTNFARRPEEEELHRLPHLPSHSAPAKKSLFDRMKIQVHLWTQ